jgi:hypothetical protein
MLIHDEFPYIIKTIPKHIFYNLKNEIGKVNLTPYNDKLAGSIEKEYKISHDYQFERFIYTSSKELVSKFKRINFSTDTVVDFRIFEKSLCIQDLWVNFQSKYEYNPLHIHMGVFSFVIYIQIPYLLEEEDKLPNTINSNTKTNSRFYFYGTLEDGSIKDCCLNIDKSWEGKMIIFPSSLSHQVFPFYTSDDYRISVAGNLSMKHLKYEYV